MSEDSLTKILNAASMMQITDVISAIEDYMSDTLSISNCYNYKELAALYMLDQLLKTVDEFIFENVVDRSF